jgi:hypothetical protein
VDGGGASLAIVASGGKAVAYLCDGRSAEAWLWGPVRGGHLELRNRSGGRLVATAGGGRASGSVVTGGRSWTFTLAAVRAPSGLYRSAAKVRGATVVSGWVVLADGTQVGLSTPLAGTPAPAPSLDPATGRTTIDGTATTAGAVDPDTFAGQ